MYGRDNVWIYPNLWLFQSVSFHTLNRGMECVHRTFKQVIYAFEHENTVHFLKHKKQIVIETSGYYMILHHAH